MGDLKPNTNSNNSNYYADDALDNAPSSAANEHIDNTIPKQAKSSDKRGTSRHQTRLACIQEIVHLIHIGQGSTDSALNIDQDFFKKLYHYASDNRQMIRDLADQYLKTKKFATLSIVLRSILYCAISEMIFIRTPARVLIAEYVTLTRRLLANNDYKLVHGLLDSMNKNDIKQS